MIHVSTLRQLGGVTALLVTVGLWGCASEPVDQTLATETATDEKPLVVATTTVLCDLTQQIAQDTVDLTCLLDPGQDPHVYEVTPSDRRAIEDADLILDGGYNYVPALSRLLSTNNTVTQVAVYEVAVPNPLMGASHDHEHDDHGHAEHEHDDPNHTPEAAPESAAAEEDVPDPHVWHDAQNGAAIAEVVAANLTQVAPTHAELYRQNTDAIVDDLRAIETWIQAQVATVPEAQRRLVTTHDSFRYYAQAYDFMVQGALAGLSTEQRPSASQITALVNQVKASDVPAIFAEVTTNRQLIETVAKDAQVAVPDQELFVEGPGGSGTPAETYQQMLVVNTCTIVNALGGQCALEQAPVQPQG